MNRALGIIFTVLLLIFLAGLAAPFFLNEPIRKSLETEISDNPNLDVDVHIGKLNIGIWSGAVKADSVELIQKNDRIPVKTITAKNIQIDGINWLSLLNRKIPAFKTLAIIQPEVLMISNNLKLPERSKSNKNGANKEENPVSDFDLNIQDGTLTLLHTNGDSIFAIQNFSLNADQINSNSFRSDSAKNYFGDLDFSASGISGQLKEQLYDLSIQNINLSSSENSAEISGLEFTPQLAKYAFSEQRGKQIDRLDLNIPQISITGINTDSIQMGIINLDSLIIHEASLDVFRNKQIDRAPSDTLKPLVNDMAHAIPLPFQLNVAQINNSKVVYSEHRPPSDTLASVSFNRMFGEIKHFQSFTHPNFGNDTLTLHAETYFMDEALLTVDVAYPVFKNDDEHFLSAKLDSINPKVAGDMLQYVGFVKINSGMVHGLQTEIQLNDTSSSGTVTILYSDLDISLVNKNNPDKRGLKEIITDFVTDNFILKSENSEEDPRVGEIDFEREKEKSIFAYWWKSLLSGIKNSVS